MCTTQCECSPRGVLEGSGTQIIETGLEVALLTIRARLCVCLTPVVNIPMAVRAILERGRELPTALRMHFGVTMVASNSRVTAL